LVCAASIITSILAWIWLIWSLHKRSDFPK
jgi:hypothetical protein